MRIDLGDWVGQNGAIMDKLLALPFEIQAMLVAGYLAYRISITGMDAQLSAHDRLFQVLAFGFIGWFAAKALPIGDRLIFAGVVFAVSINASMAWRAFARNWVFAFMRWIGVHTSDGVDNTLTSIVHGNARLKWGNVDVFTHDGHIYRSNMAKVMDEGTPTNETFIDTKGNVALYVTGIERPDGSESVLSIKNEGAAIITYIPATEIRRMDITWEIPPTKRN